MFVFSYLIHIWETLILILGFSGNMWMYEMCENEVGIHLFILHYKV